MDRSIIDASSGGALGDLNPFEARSLVENMISNSQQFNARSNDPIVGTNAARQDKIESKIDSLTTLITQLAMNQQKYSLSRVCGFATQSIIRVTCSLLCLSQKLQQNYDPSSNTYNPGRRTPTPFQNNAGQNKPSYVPPPIQQQRQQMINNHAPIDPSLEEFVKLMTMESIQFQQDTRVFIQRQESSIQNMTT
ncbi:hypothetical protein Lal_00015288 [Lupinus albus]|nr:hypothetical protein Lal_00015288 [Lupinus albus]